MNLGGNVSVSIVLGLDVGTTSVSAVALSLTGRILHSCSRAHGAEVTGLPEDYSEQDPAQLLQTARVVLKELLAQEAVRQGGTILGLGLTGQMHGIICLDRAGAPIGNLITWRDRRGMRLQAEQQPGGQSILEQMQAVLPMDFPDRLGCQLRAGYAVVTLAALRQSGAWGAGVTQLADVTGWVAAQLTGRPPKIDPTFAASWGLYDLTTGGYAREVLQASGFDEQLLGSMLPEIASSGEVLGTISPSAAREWGLPQGLSIGVGVGDNQASFLGSIRAADREVLMNIGTGGQVAWRHAGSQRTAEIEVRPLPGEGFLQVGAGLAGGDAYAWLVRQVRGWLSEFGVRPDEESLHAHLAAACAQVRTGKVEQHSMVCAPYFRGTRAEPLRRGAFVNIGTENFSLGHLAEAVLGGIVEGLCELHERADQRPELLERVVVAGNFFQHHPWTAERIASRWGVPVETPAYGEQAACGAAWLMARNWGGIHQAEGDDASANDASTVSSTHPAPRLHRDYVRLA